SAVFLVLVLVLVLLVLVLLPLLQGQFAALLGRLPGLIQLANERLLPWLEAHAGIDPGAYQLSALSAGLSGNLDQVGRVAAGFWGALTSSSAALLGLLANLVLIPVLTFYLLRDWDRFIASVHHLLPRQIEPTVASLVLESDAVLGAFLKGQLIVMLALGAIYALGLLLIGLDFALLIGLLAGVVSFVPYLGLILGLAAALVAALLQFQELSALIPVLLVFGVGQMAESVVLTPVFVGDRIGLHPVAVIFVVLAGGHLFGFFGILLALPAGAVVMVLLRRGYRHYLSSPLYYRRPESRG
ncbi:MAG: AI-2E family transporter, partial [Candidatus Competibacterales bacterium]|nr:AI-2E family transporter [Candidatus Competibacterales bacterium]